MAVVARGVGLNKVKIPFLNSSSALVRNHALGQEGHDHPAVVTPDPHMSDPHMSDPSRSIPVLIVEQYDSADPTDRDEDWISALQAELPHMDVAGWDRSMPLADHPLSSRPQVFALVWCTPLPVLVDALPGLVGVLVRGAGTDQFVRSENDLPSGVPLVRLIDPHAVRSMARFALFWALRRQLHIDEYAKFQVKSEWGYMPLPSDELEVSVLGFGPFGREIASMLAATGMRVRVWRRRSVPPGTIEMTERGNKIHMFGGDSLMECLRGVDVVVNVLPAAEETKGVLGTTQLQILRRAASLVTVGRFATVDVEAVLTALDNGILSSAVFDAFATEPLPKTSPLWRHPGVHVTPHVSGRTNTKVSASVLADNIRRMLAGKSPSHVVS